METERWITGESESGWTHARRVSNTPEGRIVQSYDGRGNYWYVTTYCAWGVRGEFCKNTSVRRTLGSEDDARSYSDAVLVSRA